MEEVSKGRNWLELEKKLLKFKEKFKMNSGAIMNKSDREKNCWKESEKQLHQWKEAANNLEPNFFGQEKKLYKDIITQRWQGEKLLLLGSCYSHAKTKVCEKKKLRENSNIFKLPLKRYLIVHW